MRAIADLAPGYCHWFPLWEGPGAAQMTWDQGMLNQVPELEGRGDSVPLALLRFYTWAPAAISLGYHQRQWPPHWQQVRWQGHPLDLVPRPSGGRAVLHQGDLTYSVLVPWGHLGRQESYCRLCDGLVAGWQQLGVPLTYGTAGRGYIHRPDCFGTATAADLVTATGFKLVGSAQVRRWGWVLQQGSMRLWPDAALHHQVFGTALGEWARPGWLGEQPTGAVLERVVAVLAAAIAEKIGLPLYPREALHPPDSQRTFGK